MEVKNDYAHVTTQNNLNKFIEINFSFQMYGLAVMLSIPRLTTSKNIDEIHTRLEQEIRIIPLEIQSK